MRRTGGGRGGHKVAASPNGQRLLCAHGAISEEGVLDKRDLPRTGSRCVCYYCFVGTSEGIMKERVAQRTKARCTETMQKRNTPDFPHVHLKQSQQPREPLVRVALCP